MHSFFFTHFSQVEPFILDENEVLCFGYYFFKKQGQNNIKQNAMFWKIFFSYKQIECFSTMNSVALPSKS